MKLIIIGLIAVSLVKCSPVFKRETDDLSPLNEVSNYILYFSFNYFYEEMVFFFFLRCCNATCHGFLLIIILLLYRSDVTRVIPNEH